MVRHKPKINVGDDVEKKEYVYTVGENVNYCNCCGNQYGHSLKTKIELPYPRNRVTIPRI
jgi:hypothetical protein